MKVLVIGLGALEHDLVEEFDLKNLKQKEHGKVTIPIGETFADPSPTLIWTSFITGKNPGEFGFDNVIVYREPFRAFLSIYYKLKPKSSYKDILDKETSKRRRTANYISQKFLEYGIAERPHRKHIKGPTLVDSPDCFHYNLPVIDMIYNTVQDKSIRSASLEGNDSIKTFYESEWRKQFESNKQIIFDSLKQDWNFGIYYFGLLDDIQHVFYNDRLKINTYYLYIDRFIGELKSKLPKDTVLLVLGDYGKKNGLHTNHGFYSCNRPINLKNPKITEFKSLIEKLMLPAEQQ